MRIKFAQPQRQQHVRSGPDGHVGARPFNLLNTRQVQPILKSNSLLFDLKKSRFVLSNTHCLPLLYELETMSVVICIYRQMLNWFTKRLFQRKLTCICSCLKYYICRAPTNKTIVSSTKRIT